MDNQVESEKILSLQALRGLAFLGIFFVHTRAPVSWATLGVSTFLSFRAVSFITEMGSRDCLARLRRICYLRGRK